MAKTNYPSITPLTSTVGQSEITFRFNVTSFNEISELYWEVCNEEDPTSTIASGYLENDHDFWPYGVNFEIEITELEYNSGSYICRLSATNSNGTTESTQKCTLEKYIDWAEPESVLAGNRFIANGSEEIGSLPAIDASEISVDGDEIIIPVGVVTQQVTVQAESIDYLCFTAQEANSTVTASKPSGLSLANIMCSRDRTNWTRMLADQTLTLENAGDKLYVYGNNLSGLNKTRFVLTGNITCSGNILTLLTKNGSVTTLPESAFYGLFQGSTGLTRAPELFNIPLSERCYQQMFQGCTSLTEAPALPATTLADSCYLDMFTGCTSLTKAPSLPATTLDSNCYRRMFKDCTALTLAPELAAEVMAERSYSEMFQNCTALTQAPALPATTLAKSCYEMMFYGCTSLTQAPALPATTMAERCYQQMFLGCTSLVEAPHLPAPNMNVTGCYSNMFNGCSSLNKIVTSAQSWTANRANNWVRGVAEVGDFYNLGGATIDSGVNGIPSGWTEHNSL